MFGHGSPATGARSARIEGRIRGTGRVEGVRYPSPFFDLAHTYLPSSVKQMFRWCRYYYLTNPLIATVVNKLAEYPITDLVIDTGNRGLKNRWEGYFEEDILLRSSLIDIGLFYTCYGNSPISMSFPFVKWLKCESCRAEEQAKLAKYQFRSCKFYLECKKCGHVGPAEVRDEFLSTTNGARLILWNPEDIDIQYNELTGETTYYYSLPTHLQSAIRVGRRDVVDRSPQIYIDAVRKKKSVVLDPDNVYHMRRPSILTGRLNRGWGTPLLLPVLKDTFYLQLMKKAQEAVLLERMLPLNVISPAQTAPGTNPYELVDLSKWREHVMNEIIKWRRDPLYIPIMPVALNHQTIGGDGRALLLNNEMRQISDIIMAGIGCPPELVWGGLSWCLRGLTRVSTVGGLRYLKDVVADGPGREVLTEDGPRKILAVHKAGVKRAYSLRTARGFELTGAETHRVLTLLPDLRLEYRKLSELSVGDHVVARRGSSVEPGRPATLPAVSRQKNEKLEVPRGPERLTLELARLFGYLVAEGSVDDERVRFTNTDHGVVEDYLGCFETVFGFRPATIIESGKYHRVEVWSRALACFFGECGVGGHSHEKRVPPSVLSSPHSYVGAYLSAYFEGGGGVSFKPDGGGHVSATSVSEELIRDTQLLLLNLGVLSSRYRTETAHRDRHDVVIRGRNDLETFEQKVGFRSKEKKGRLQKLITGLRRNSDSIPYLRDQVRLFRDRCGLDRNNWQWAPFELEDVKDAYRVEEVAAILQRRCETVVEHIHRGRLSATPCHAKHGGYEITGKALQEFCSKYGRGVQVRVPNLREGATRHNTSDFALGYISEKDPELAGRIKTILDSDYVFERISSVDEVEPEEMFDLTVEGTHSYIADGLVTHNSGSNVSLRILENQFLRYLASLLRFIKTFVIRRTAAHLGWPEINVRFKPFKMADDLQRKAFIFQANRAKLVSDTTMRQEMDLNPEEEDELLKTEVKRRLESVEKQQLAEAQIAGKAQVVQAKFQARAQMALSEEQQQMEQGTYGTAPGEPGAGVRRPGVTPGAAPSQQQGAFSQMVQRLQGLSPKAQQSVLQRIGAQNAELASALQNQLQGSAPQGGDSAGKPLPEQLPPRRDATLI